MKVHTIDCDLGVDCLCGATQAEVFEEGDRHGCCCEHVIESLDAQPGSAEDHYSAAREKFYSCPHRTLTPLEIYLTVVRA